MYGIQIPALQRYPNSVLETSREIVWIFILPFRYSRYFQVTEDGVLMVLLQFSGSDFSVGTKSRVGG